MKNSYTLTPKASIQNQGALHLMINQLSVSMLSTAIRRENVLVNEIPADLYVYTDAHKLAAVIGSLLHTVLGHSKNSYIRISAKNYGDVTLVHIKDNGRLHSPAFAGSLIEIQHLAERIGGSVSVTSCRNDVTTVALSFVNLPPATWSGARLPARQVRSRSLEYC